MGAAPVTLTPAQFRGTKAAGKPGATYGKYLAYVAKARAGGVKGTPADRGLDPTSQAAINAAVGHVVRLYGGGGASLAPKSEPQIEAEAKGYATAQTQPIIDQITSSLNARAHAGMSSIAGLSKNLIDEQQPAAAGYMNDALRSAAARSAITGGLASQAAGEGQSEQAGVAAKLAAIGAPGASDVFAQNAGGLGKQIATETTSRGATAAADTVNRGEAAAGQASALPGIASLAAIRSGRLLQEQTNQNLASETGKVTAGLPGMVASIFENLKSQELTKAGQRSQVGAQRAGAVEQMILHFGDQNVQKALARQGFGLDLTKLGVGEQNAETAAAAKVTAAQTAAEARVAAAQKVADAKVAAATAGKGAKTQHSAHVAVSRATTLASSYIDRTVKPQPIYQRVLDNSTTPPTYKQVVTGYGKVPPYYDVIHAVEARVRPILAPYMGEADIVRFVQQLINSNPHYKPGSSTGRPAAQPPSGPPAPGRTAPVAPPAH